MNEQFRLREICQDTGFEGAAIDHGLRKSLCFVLSDTATTWGTLRLTQECFVWLMKVAQ